MALGGRPRGEGIIWGASPKFRHWAPESPVAGRTGICAYEKAPWETETHPASLLPSSSLLLPTDPLGGNVLQGNLT